jgi:hypothetical protein
VPSGPSPSSASVSVLLVWMRKPSPSVFILTKHFGWVAQKSYRARHLIKPRCGVGPAPTITFFMHPKRTLDQRISAIMTECWAEIEVMMACGASVEDVARFCALALVDEDSCQAKLDHN